MRGLQTGPDLVPALFDAAPRKKPKLLAIIVLLLAATGAWAAVASDPLGSYRATPVPEWGGVYYDDPTTDSSGTGECSLYEERSCQTGCEAANLNPEHCMAWMSGCSEQPGGWVKCACEYFCANDPWGGARRPDDGGATWPVLATDECQPWDDLR